VKANETLGRVGQTAADDRDYWISLNQWAERAGVSETTMWRWRRRGWLQTVSVGGRLFITPKALAEFERRAASGEFALKRQPPRCKPGAAINN
jgi:hypothetical protein